jgi:hypothetical protein
MDPITIIVSAIVIGAAAGLEPTASTAVKDAYQGLKQVIIDHYKDYRGIVKSLGFVDDHPEDIDLHELLKKKLIDAGAEKDTELIKAADKVHMKMKESDPDVYEKAIGMYIGKLEAHELDVEGVSASGKGIDAKIDHAKIQGKATFRDIGNKQKPDPNQ